MNRYRNDPRWITARFTSKCHGGDHNVTKGARAFFYPSSKSIYCEACGQEHAADFEAARFDEDNNTCM